MPSASACLGRKLEAGFSRNSPLPVGTRSHRLQAVECSLIHAASRRSWRNPSGVQLRTVKREKLELIRSNWVVDPYQPTTLVAPVANRFSLEWLTARATMITRPSGIRRPSRIERSSWVRDASWVRGSSGIRNASGVSRATRVARTVDANPSHALLTRAASFGGEDRRSTTQQQCRHDQGKYS